MTESDDLKELRERALAPETNANELFEISAQHPEVYAEVAANPNAYPDLLDWLENVGDDRVKAVVTARRDGLSGSEALAKVGQEEPEAALGEQETPLEVDSAPTETVASESAPAAFAPPVNPEEAEVTAQTEETEQPEAADPAAEGAEAETEELTENPVASANAPADKSENFNEGTQSPEDAGSDGPSDDDATRLGTMPPASPESSAQPVEDYPTLMASPMAAPAAMPPTYSAPAYPEPGYPEPPRQPPIRLSLPTRIQRGRVLPNPKNLSVAGGLSF